MLKRSREVKRFEKKVAAWFKWQGREVVKRLPRLKKYFAESEASDIDKMIDDALNVTVNNGEKFFSDGLLNGYTTGYADLENSLELQKAFSLPHPDAVAWAEKNAALDVADVTKTTKKHIKNLIVHGLEEGESYDSVARAIRNQFSGPGKPNFSVHRARLIAVTENAKAYEEGGRTLVNEIQATGIDMEKSWHTVGDNNVSDGCQDNAADGWISANDEFSSGDQMPPRFPSCRCNTHYRVSRE